MAPHRAACDARLGDLGVVRNRNTPGGTVLNKPVTIDSTHAAPISERTDQRILRVCFIHCPDPVYADTQNYGAQFMPVWAYTLAAHIPQDGRFRLSLHDTRVDPVESLQPADVFLFSGINQDHGNLLRVHTELKRRFPTMISVIGGPI